MTSGNDGREQPGMRDQRPAPTQVLTAACLTVKQYRTAVISTAAILVLFYFLYYSFAHSGALQPLGPSEPQVNRNARVAKASMLYGAENDLIKRAVASHKRHNDKFGYEMHMLRQDMTKGYWNKLGYLLNLIMEELQKDEEKRVEWIAWFDPDVVMLNPEIPLELFLPPADDAFEFVSFIGSRNGGDLNTGVFFLRVNPWSMKFLVRSMAEEVPEFPPRGYTMDQIAMAKVLNNTDFRSDVFYEPRAWFSPLKTHSEFEARPGDLCVQFLPGLGGARWKAMNDLMDSLDATPGQFEKPLEETTYMDDVNKFWERVSEAGGALFEAQRKAEELGDGAGEGLRKAIDRLIEVIGFEPDNSSAMDLAIAEATLHTKTT